MSGGRKVRNVGELRGAAVFDRHGLRPLDQDARAEGGVWQGVHNRTLRIDDRSPIDRWRLAVGVAVQPVAPLVAALLLWGVLGTEARWRWADEALVLASGVGGSAMVLLLSAIFLGLLGTVSGTWRPGNAR